MFAYQLIEIVESLNAAVRRGLTSVIAKRYLSESLRSEAQSLLDKAQRLDEQITDAPDIDCLFVGLGDLRADFEQFMKNLRL